MANDPHTHDAGHHDDHEHHVLPLSIYFGVFGGLMVLTVLTVLVSHWNLGALSLPVAMAVAIVKAALVIGFFMHLRYDDKFYTLIFFGSLVFIGLFFGFTMMDLGTRGTMVPEEQQFMLKNQRPENIKKMAAIAPKKRKKVHHGGHGDHGAKKDHGHKKGHGHQKGHKKDGAHKKGDNHKGQKKHSKALPTRPAPRVGLPAPAARREAVAKREAPAARREAVAKRKAPVARPQVRVAPAGLGAFAARREPPKPRVAPAVLALGKQKFNTFCVSCHGASGAGNGAAAAALNPKPTNFAKGEYRYGGDFKSVLNIITNGSPKYPVMVAWKAAIPKKSDREAIAHYVLSLKK